MRAIADAYDVAIIGGGPGGYAAALYGASAGLAIALIESEKIGGTCLHRGCIPTKQLLETANVLRTVRSAADFGVIASGQTESGVDWGVASERKTSTVDSLFKGLTGLLKKRKVDLIDGRGRLGPGGRVAVTTGAGEEVAVEARAVIVATGSRPRSIPGFEFDGKRIISSDEALTLESVPRRIAIVGAGAIGMEFASLFADLGVEVTVLEALPRILPGVDDDIAAVLDRSLKRRGVTIEIGAAVDSHTPAPTGNTASLLTYRTSSGEMARIEVDRILLAVGREPVTDSAGLAEVGLNLDRKGYIEIDPLTMSTSLPATYAVGDVVDTPALAHIAFAEGMVAIRSILGEAPNPVEYSRVPWCIYSHPEISFAGMTQAAATEQLGGAEQVAVSKHRFGGVGRALIMGETEGMVKVVAEKGGRILGVHIVGPLASELLAPGYLSTNWEALPGEVAAFIEPHPSLSEAFGEAVQALTGRSLHG